MEAAIITTYRCNCRCRMCNIWRHPTGKETEFSPGILEKLPRLKFANITGGEPMLRDDIGDIIEIASKKADRVVISTNGYFTDRIVNLAGKHKGNLGVRVSLEGLPAANDELRGIEHGFDRGLRTILELQRLGLGDIGFGITVSDRNAGDMVELYQLAKAMGVEFATAVVHNSYYFHKNDNVIEDKKKVAACFEKLISELLKTSRPKNWFRAYFNHGLINYINGRPRLLPCRAGDDIFFLDPAAEIRPCNGLDEANPGNSMGNLKDADFPEIWGSEKAAEVRGMVRNCRKNCWMIGTAAPAIKKNLPEVSLWVLKHKIRPFGRG